MSNKRKKIALLIVYISSLLMLSQLSLLVYAQSNRTSTVNATVKVSVCGNGIVESGDDCEGENLQSRTCSNLGYLSGNLSCDISCSFDASSCVAPTFSPDNISSDDISSLLPAGYFSIPQTASLVSTPSLTATSQMTFSIQMSSGTSSVILPRDLMISRVDGANLDPTTLITSGVTTSSLSGFSQGVTVDGALQWGISNVHLQFDTPVTISIYVGTSLNNQTLNVVRSTNLDSGWTNDGIVSPATCLVASGFCTFQVTKASYFATNRAVSSTPTPTSTITPTSTPTPTPTPTTSATSSSSSVTSTSAPTSIPTPTSTPKPTLPFSLSIFDINRDGIIKLKELYPAVEKWVDEWRNAIIEEVAESNECDVNNDDRCNLKDFSMLLYYVER